MDKEVRREFAKVWAVIKQLKVGKAKEKTLQQKKSKLSITELIRELKADDFFEPPKTSEEIRKALAANGHHYAASSLTWPLQDLVRKRELGRIPEGKGWKYAAR